MKKLLLSAASVGLISLGVVSNANASYILFDQSTDTISVAGQTVIGTSFTIEARVLFTNEYNGAGKIFNEWSLATEDKLLYAGPTVIRGRSYGAGSDLSSNTVLSLNSWHHIAYVYDGSEKRLYLDGQQISSVAASGNVRDGSRNAQIGAIFRDGAINAGFVGYMDTLRISDTARYNTASFLPQNGDLTSDASTLLLYNFTESLGSSTITDLSGNGHDGTLGVGFSGATAPIFSSPVPVPSAVWLFGSGLLGLIGVVKRKIPN